MPGQYLISNSCLNASNDGVLTTLLSSSKGIRLTEIVGGRPPEGGALLWADKDLRLSPSGH